MTKRSVLLLGMALLVFVVPRLLPEWIGDLGLVAIAALVVSTVITLLVRDSQQAKRKHGYYGDLEASMRREIEDLRSETDR